MPTADEIPERLHRHLVSWLGAWPPAPLGVTVVAHEPRTRPGWDGHFHSVVGVATENAAILSVPPGVADAVASLVRQQNLETDLGALRTGIARAMENQGRLGRGRFRWSDSPTQTPNVGDWTPTDDDRVPEWLKPFNGDVLIAWDDDGHYGAGVGRKIHDTNGHEISVGTEQSLRGRGIGRKLVATAARRILDDGAIPTYLHAFDNFASSKVADAAGFPDVGWTVLGFWPLEPDDV